MNIEIDCPPGETRPGYLFKSILEILSKHGNQKIKDFSKKNLNKEPDTKLFGNWTWNLEIQTEIQGEVQNEFKKRLTEYYNNGIIRYASW
jgi:hypothetical protein